MKHTGRISSILLVMVIQTAHVIYYMNRDGYVDFIGWIGYPLLLLISYWTGLQYDKANYYSAKDPLTDLYNRRYMMKYFKKYSRMAKSRKKKLFILLFDCDRFKEINDRYGHAVGDQILREVGKVLSYKRKELFSVARWGGDEFLAVGCCQDHTEVQRLMKELTQAFYNIKVEKVNGPISISIGSVIQEDANGCMHELISAADASMYNEKGRDRLVYTEKESLHSV
ncbi:GGDEF domain-containing protein [Bacillus sp. FJAT-45037]|uniref:GGDEF domain-containing protein n=1 Tax=Bacillus sp. FJAT-45037 TaxID=2011007 RepID=UPI000C23DFA4|nr:GGDEF domain-containing protein [Bacillus sp. FJAT-45037]